MPIATTRNAAAVGVGGSGYAWWKEVDSDGTDLATPDTVHPAFIHKSSGLAVASNETKDKDEGGNEYTTKIEETGDFEIDPMQFDDATLQLRFVLKGKYVQIVKLLNENAINAIRAYQLIPVAQFIGGGDIKDGKVNPFKFKAIKPAADVTVTLSNSGGTPTVPGAPGTATGSLICLQENFDGILSVTQV